MSKQAARYTFSHRLPFQISGLHEKTKRGKAKIRKETKTKTLSRTTKKTPNRFYYARPEVKSLEYSFASKQWKKVIQRALTDSSALRLRNRLKTGPWGHCSHLGGHLTGVEKR